MKKGKVRIGLGIALIALQLMSLMGNAKAGIGIQLSFASMEAFMYSLVFTLSYLLVGIIGTILLISGIMAHRKGNTSKVTAIVSEEEEQLPVSEKADPLPVSEKAVRKKAKQTYCKLCGGAIDHQSRKCTKCNKQYFRVTKKGIAALCVCVLFISFLIIVVYQHNYYTARIASLNDYIEILETSRDSKNYDIWCSNNVIRELSIKQGDLEKEVEFYEEHVVFVLNNGTGLYHKYGCSDFDAASFIAYDTDTAAKYGYKPCPMCCH